MNYSDSHIVLGLCSAMLAFSKGTRHVCVSEGLLPLQLGQLQACTAWGHAQQCCVPRCAHARTHLHLSVLPGMHAECLAYS